MYNRRGRFYISGEQLRDKNLYNRLAPVMKNFIALRVDFNVATDRAEYSGIHPAFRELNQGDIIPLYKYDVSNKGVAWRLVDENT